RPHARRGPAELLHGQARGHGDSLAATATRRNHPIHALSKNEGLVRAGHCAAAGACPRPVVETAMRKGRAATPESGGDKDMASTGLTRRALALGAGTAALLGIFAGT